VDGFVQAINTAYPFPNLFGHLWVHFCSNNVRLARGKVNYRKGYEGDAEEHRNHEEKPFKEIV
jgi:hypothetical protein